MIHPLEMLEARTLLAAGGLDPSFGDGGRATDTIEYPDPGRAAAVVVRPDGRVLIAGDVSRYGSPDVTLTQLNPDGTLDATFGDGGRAGRVGYANGSARAVALQPDGKVVVAGADRFGRFLVARFNADGSPDVTFAGWRGGVTTAFGRTHVDVSSVVVRPDGRILVGGQAWNGDGGLSDDTSALAFAQLLPDGTPDAEFGRFKDGTVLAEMGRGAAVHAMAAAPDGRVYFAGLVGGDVHFAWIDERGERFGATVGPGNVGGLLDLGGADDDVLALSVLDRGRGFVFVGRSGGNFVIARLDPDGRRVTRFGDGGQAVYDFGSSTDVARAVVPLADGRFVVVGATGDAATGTARGAALRFTARGRLDRTFGVSGPARFDSGAGRQFETGGAAATPAGKIVVAGTAGPADDGDPTTLQLTADGALDAAFGPGKDGRATYPWHSQAYTDDTATAVQADGKILIAHSVSGRLPSALGITRFNADGSLDRAFGEGGTLFVAVPNAALDIVSLAITIEPGGRALLAMNASHGEGADRVDRTTLLALRLGDGGKLDPSFGDGGRAQVADRKNEYSGTSVLALQDDGRILVGQSEGTNFVVYRLTAAGRRDGTFGSGGRAVVSVQLPDNPTFAYAQVNAMALDADGRIVLAGASGVSPSGFFPGEPHARSFFTLARLTAAGLPDPTFGLAGVVTTPFPALRYFGSANALRILPDGRILAGGSAQADDAQGFVPIDFVVARYRADGSPDPTFGTAPGYTVVRLPYHGDNWLTGLSVGRDGKILAVGTVSTDVVALARLTPDGRPDPTYGDGGSLIAPFYPDQRARGFSPENVVPSADGSVIVGTSIDAGALVAMRFRADDQPAVLADVEGGVLRVRGTAADDRIVLRRDRRTGRVEIDGVAQTFGPATFSRVDVQALDGDDRVDLSALGLPATTDGGAGDDVILGSSAPDSILGGAGDDTLFGGGGADTLRGGDGNDYLSGGPGGDQLFGDAGNDQIFAVDSAVDTIDGGAGFDRVKADADDLLSNTEGLLA